MRSFHTNGIQVSLIMNPAESSATTPLLDAPGTVSAEPMATEAATTTTTEQGSPSSDPPAVVENALQREQPPPSHPALGVLSIMTSAFTDDSGSPFSVAVGLSTILFVGAVLGLIISAIENDSSENDSTTKLSAILGYCYFTCWSISFYPQILSNYRRKSTDGLSFDFCCLNVLGFACYATYNLSFYFNPTIRQLFFERYSGNSNHTSSGDNDDANPQITVQSNDVAFAVHAMLLSGITVGQIIYYHNSANRQELLSLSSSRSRPNSLRLSPIVSVIFTVLMAIILVYPFGIVSMDLHDRQQKGNTTNTTNATFTDSHIIDRRMLIFAVEDYTTNSTTPSEHTPRLFYIGDWLDYIYLLSYIKVIISLIKYIPQVIQNKRRQSTVGWSIWNIVLDCTGGTLSTVQLLLDCHASTSSAKDFWIALEGNLAKLALGMCSILFDIIFLIQHYVLYPAGSNANNGGGGGEDQQSDGETSIPLLLDPHDQQQTQTSSDTPTSAFV